MRRIGFVSLTPNAGSKFVAACLACYLAREQQLDPAVLELGTPGLYDALSLDRRFAGRPFYEAGTLPNRAGGVNWQVQLPRGLRPTEDELRPSPMPVSLPWYEHLKRIDRVEGDAVLCLLNGMPKEEQQFLLREMDCTVLVVDPLPSQLLAAGENLSQQETDLTVVNKMNGGVKKHQLESFLKRTPRVQIPLIAGEHLYRAEYSGCFPYEMESVRQMLEPSLEALWRAMQ